MALGKTGSGDYSVPSLCLVGRFGTDAGRNDPVVSNFGQQRD